MTPQKIGLLEEDDENGNQFFLYVTKIKQREIKMVSGGNEKVANENIGNRMRDIIVCITNPIIHNT